jgi:hypothetical protein
MDVLAGVRESRDLAKKAGLPVQHRQRRFHRHLQHRSRDRA